MAIEKFLVIEFRPRHLKLKTHTSILSLFEINSQN